MFKKEASGGEGGHIGENFRQPNVKWWTSKGLREFHHDHQVQLGLIFPLLIISTYEKSENF